MRLPFLVLFILSFNLRAGDKQNTDLKTVASGVTQAMSQVKQATSTPQPACTATESLHMANDNCGSRVPASYWKEFAYNLNELKNKDIGTQAQMMNQFIDSIKDLDPLAKEEMKKAFLNMKKGESVLQSMDIYSNFLRDHDAKKLDSALEKAGYAPEDRKNFVSHMDQTLLGKNLSTLTQYGLTVDSHQGGWSRFDVASKGVITPKKISDDPNLKKALKEVFGDKVLNDISNPKRLEAISLGNLVFNPPNNESSMATYSKKEWDEKVQQHLDLYMNEIKDASEAMPKLGTMWDGWKLHSSRSHLKLVNDQYDRFNNASVQVEALTKMGFPSSEINNLNSQILRMSTASADTVNDAYNDAEGLRKKLYKVSAAAVGAAIVGPGLVVENLTGYLGYLAAAGVALPYIQNGVNAGIKVAVDGGSWWCQYAKTLPATVADSVFDTLLVFPPLKGGNTIKSIEALMKIGKEGYKYFKHGKKGWEIGSKSYDCYGATQAFKDMEEEVNFQSEMKDSLALEELKLESDEMFKSMMSSCTDLAFSGIKLGMASVSSKIQKAKDKEEEKQFQKDMKAKDALVAPKIEQYRAVATPTFKEGKSIYKSSNGATYEVKIVPDSDGKNKVFFLSGDRKDKVGSMNDSDLSELFKSGRMTTIKLQD